MCEIKATITMTFNPDEVIKTFPKSIQDVYAKLVACMIEHGESEGSAKALAFTEIRNAIKSVVAKKKSACEECR